MRRRVVATAALPGDLSRMLTEHDVVGPSAGVWPRERWLAELGDAAALVPLVSDRIDDDVLARAPGLRVVANYGVGLDNVDVAAASARGVAVTNTPDVLTEATADLAFALVLAAARRLGEGERMVRAGQWQGWAPDLLLGADVWGRTLGIVGLGRIGRAVARRGLGFGMRVVHSGGRADGVASEPVALADLLAASDVVSLHCPLTPATRGLIDAAALAAMKPTAILVNTARGPLIDEGALAEALTADRLGGAGLDVFVGEPRIDPRLLAAPRLVLAPHLGSATTTARTRMAELCAHAVRDVLAGRRPAHLVNPDAVAARYGWS